MLSDVLGIDISLGSIMNAWEDASDAVAEPHHELQELPKEPVLNVDETGWRNNGEKRQIWALWPRRSPSSRCKRRKVRKSSRRCSGFALMAGPLRRTPEPPRLIIT
jgi:hypothetical protein